MARMGRSCHLPALRCRKLRPRRRPLETPHPLRRVFESSLLPSASLPRRERQRLDPPRHCPEEPPRQMSLRQQQPVIRGVLGQPAARLHQPLLQTRQRPVVNPLRQRQPTLGGRFSRSSTGGKKLEGEVLESAWNPAISFGRSLNSKLAPSRRDYGAPTARS